MSVLPTWHCVSNQLRGDPIHGGTLRKVSFAPSMSFRVPLRGVLASKSLVILSRVLNTLALALGTFMLFRSWSPVKWRGDDPGVGCLSVGPYGIGAIKR